MVFDGNNTYLYDGEGQVCAVQGPPPVSGGPGAMTQYIYDAGGTRVAKGTITVWSCDTTVNGFIATNSYVLGPNGQQDSEETIVSGTRTWKHTNVYAGGDLVATYDSVGLHFHLSDWQGTRRVQTDYAGNVGETYPGLPYGEMPPGQDLGATEQHFTGKEHDDESGNDYFDARYYSSAMGRFLTPDWSVKAEPIPYAKVGDPQTLNLYSYVLNNPLVKFDPNGHDWFHVDNKWQWQQGHTYHDANGNATNAKGYAGLLVATISGMNSHGATTYKLTLYNQNKAVATGTGFSGGNGHAPVRDGNYIIHLDIRDPIGPNKMVNSGVDGAEPQKFYGIQAMHDIDDSEGHWPVVGAYGPMRALLNPIGGAPDHGDYFHGQTNGHGWTHGCLCYGADTRFIDYMWNNMPHVPMPVAIDTPVQKP